jgi:hypothetical protein
MLFGQATHRIIFSPLLASMAAMASMGGQMVRFDYARAGHAVRDQIVETHRDSWQKIAAAGSHWTGAQRVEIARQARAARAARNDPPWLRKGLPEAGQRLPEDAVEAARTIAADAHKIERVWAKARTESLGDAAYVELASIVATISAIDAFAEALGVAHEPLPEPTGGEPDGARLDSVADIGAYVPMRDPFDAPNVGRALSLVPEAGTLFFSNVMPMYASGDGGFFEMEWNGPLSRPQAELLAARVSSVSECFY